MASDPATQHIILDAKQTILLSPDFWPELPPRIKVSVTTGHHILRRMRLKANECTTQYSKCKNATPSLRLLPINNMHLCIKVDRQIPQLPTHTRYHDFDLLFTPAQDAREERVAVGADGFEHVDLVVAAEVLELGVFGPGGLRELRITLLDGREPGWVKRAHLVNLLGNVDKSRLLHLLLPSMRSAHRLSELL